MTQLRALQSLEPALADQVRALAADVEAADGVAALSEQFHFGLAHGSSARHLLAERAGRLVGYAQLADPGMPGSPAELLVAPRTRRQGAGTALLAALPRDARVWCHGDLPAARAFAAARGLATVRELHRMTLRLDAVELATPRLPAGLVVRSFRPGVDDEAWVRANAAAFAGHPEQGRLTVADLQERMAQPWFDPAGFFLVVPDPAREGAGESEVEGAGQGAGDSAGGGGGAGAGADNGPPIAAFHWTKAPPAEVYVVGVHPAYQGQGLGRAVTLVGLHHLRDEGYELVTLYTDGDNAPALATYRGLGFETVHVDRMVAFPADPEDATMSP